MNINEPDRIDGFHWFVMNGWKHADSWMKVPVNKGLPNEGQETSETKEQKPRDR